MQVKEEEVEPSGSESALKISPKGLTDRLDLGFEKEESTLGPRFVTRAIRQMELPFTKTGKTGSLRSSRVEF